MPTVRESVSARLTPLLPPPATKSIVAALPKGTADAELGSLDLLSFRDLLDHLGAGLKLFGAKQAPSALLGLKLGLLAGSPPAPSSVRIPVDSDAGVLQAQRASRAMTRGFFGATDCVRLVTVVSELARNIYQYAGAGEVRMSLRIERAQVVFAVDAEDHGPGIPDVAQVLSTGYRSKTGLGKGLKGAKAMLEDFSLATAIGKGTTVSGCRRARW